MKWNRSDSVLFRMHLENEGRLSESTIYTYVRSIERFLLTDPDLENINNYNDFLIDMTIRKRCPHYFYALKKFIEFKINDSNLKKTLLNGIVKPKIRFDIVRKRRHLSMNVLLDILNCMDEKHRVIALIQNMTGVRVGDIIKIKKEDIQMEEYKDKPVLRLNITGKGGKLNTVFIHDKIAQDVILNYVQFNFNYDDYAFLELGKMKNRQGQLNSEFKLTKMNYQWYWEDLKMALQTIGVNKKDFATHDFRRCFARRAWSKKQDIHRLQSLLNHSDPKVTLRYLEQSGLKNIDYHYEMQTS